MHCIEHTSNYRLSGAFVAAVRAAYIVANEIIEGKDTGRRLFVPAKNNIGPDNTGLAFKITGHQLDDGIETSRIIWQGGTIDKTADEVLAAIHTVGPNDSPKRSEAKTFLKELLAKDPLPMKQVKRLAGEAGICWRTVERAKEKLRIDATRKGFGKDAHYEWSMPKIEAANSMCRQTPDGGGTCNDNPVNLPTDGALPIDRQMAGDDGLAVHEKHTIE